MSHYTATLADFRGNHRNSAPLIPGVLHLHALLTAAGTIIARETLTALTLYSSPSFYLSISLSRAKMMSTFPIPQHWRRARKNGEYYVGNIRPMFPISSRASISFLGGIYDVPFHTALITSSARRFRELL